MTDRMDVLAEALPNWRAYLYTVANNALGADHPDRDDLAQEGLIAMWRAVGDYDPDRGVPLARFAQWKAVRRMRDVVTERSHVTGAEDRSKHSPQPRGIAARARIRAHLREHPDATGAEIAAATGMSKATVSYHRQRLHDDVESPAGATSLDALLDEGFDLTGAGDVLDGIVAAYMDGCVAEALDVLTPAERKYVVLRFWHGADAAELRDAFGYAPHALWRTAKARLAPALADLVNA